MMPIKFVLWNILFALLCFIVEELHVIGVNWLLQPLPSWLSASLMVLAVYLFSAGILLHVRSRSTAELVGERLAYLPREPAYEDIGTFLCACGFVISIIMGYRMW